MVPIDSTQTRAEAPKRLRFGCCILDEDLGCLAAPDGTHTTLRLKTLDLLRLMLRNPGRLVSRNEILDTVWPGLFVTDDSITQCVVELRKAMGRVGAEMLRTVPRRGYLLQAEVGAEQPPAPPPTLRADNRPSIAVLPFRKGRSDPEEAYFEDGIIEGIIHVLSGLDGITVISRGSALALAGEVAEARAVGQHFGVRYALYGGVRRAGDRLRITTELAETATGAIIRSDRYDGGTAELFELQDRIADQVVASVAPQLREREMVAALRKPPGSLTSYDLVLRALDRMKRDDRESMLQAKHYLDQAIAADGTNATAHAYAALWQLLNMSEGWAENVQAAVAEASRLSVLAIERDPTDALALSIRGHVVAYLDRDYLAAMLLLERAKGLGPSCPWAFAWGSLVTSYLGDHAEAVRLAERAIRLSPLDPFTYIFEHVLSQALHLAGDHAGAVAWARRSFAAKPRQMSNLRVLVCALVASGDLTAAAEMARLILRHDPGFRVSIFAARTPLPEPHRTDFVARLLQAGLPE